MSDHLEYELANHVTNTAAELSSIRRSIAVLRETIPPTSAKVVQLHGNDPRILALEKKVDDLAQQMHRLIGVVERGFLDT